MKATITDLKATITDFLNFYFALDKKYKDCYIKYCEAIIFKGGIYLWM